MDWTEDGEGMRQRLMRIVALLLALATLAERACRAPLAVRVLVMGFLRPAEQVAWNFIAGGCALPVPAGESDDPASAMRLAGRFRALAIALAAFADRFSECSRVPVGISPRAVEAEADFTDLDRARPQPFDTS
ncbi:hypothetical protein [Mesorhizobium sp. ZC-5]|uniref:hypothetical protein n=1 Tax=Mesorhizobium sp. ZC-5 TaxID=2986066 RepID=UPI0021E744CA|nr:hypothetical protein [Mesorhizobium sp. ZC-5]MCV3241110.1 hypothetical protein [Mesorhizobium sp. ZC-5]